MRTSPSFFAQVASVRARLDVLDRTYKRDKRGRFGSGSGVRESLANAKTTDEVATVLATELHATMGHPVQVSLKGMDVESARGSAEGVLQGAERFPDAPLGKISTYGPGGDIRRGREDSFGLMIATTTHGAGKNSDEIAFNTEFGTPKGRATMERAHQAGDLVVGTHTGVGLHEFGHTLLHGDAPERAHAAAAGAAKKAGRDTSDYVAEHISNYATESRHETAAEAFADVMTNGSKASKLSKEIFDATVSSTKNTATFHGHVRARREQVDLLNRVYKRDKDGKFGSGGGSGDVRESLAKAGTTTEIASAAAAEAKRITGHDIAFDMSGSDPGVAREHCEGVLQGLERFPAARLERVDTYGPGGNTSEAGARAEQTLPGAMAVTSGRLDMSGKPVIVSSIHFNNKFAADPAGYHEVLSRPSTTSCVATTPRGTGLHEFGHVVANHDSAIPRRVLDEAVRQSAVVGQSPGRYLTEHVSNYAAADQHELAAEVFADSMLHGSGASVMSQSGFDIMDAAYNTSVGPGNTLTVLPRARTYKRDSKGRFGSGGGVRDALAKAGTTEEVAAVVSAEVSRIAGREIPVDFDGSDVQIAREHGEAVIQGMEAFPHAPLAYVTTYGPGSRPSEISQEADAHHSESFAVTDVEGPTLTLPNGRMVAFSGAIAFNNRFAGDPAAYHKKIADEHVDGLRHMVAENPFGVATHEFGHVMQINGKPDNPTLAAREVVYAAGKAAGHPTKVTAVIHISTYAGQSTNEMHAEIFADVMLHGSGASQVSQDAFDASVAMHNGWTASLGLS